VRTERTPTHAVAHNFSPAVALGFHFRTPSSPPPLYTMLRLGLISSADRSFAWSGALAGTLEDEFRQSETVSR
jgi:hypothetical protein